MGKHFVAIANNATKYRLDRDDIKKVFIFKQKRLPRLPAFNSFQKDSDNDSMTNCD